MLRVIFPVSLFPELVVERSELLKETDIGFNFSDGSHRGDGLRGGHALVLHEVGGHDGRRPGHAQEAVDEHEPAAERQRPVDEGRTGLEVLRDIRVRQIGQPKAQVRDAGFGQLSRVERDVAFGRVEHVSHAQFVEVSHVFGRGSVADDDAWEDLVAVHSTPESLGVVFVDRHSGHHSPLRRVDVERTG